MEHLSVCASGNTPLSGAKRIGETNHIERLNNTLRQWCANLVQKTLSFSKDLELHKTRIRMVIEHRNARTDL